MSEWLKEHAWKAKPVSDTDTLRVCSAGVELQELGAHQGAIAVNELSEVAANSSASG
jgi:hypothetical protein